MRGLLYAKCIVGGTSEAIDILVSYEKIFAVNVDKKSILLVDGKWYSLIVGFDDFYKDYKNIFMNYISYDDLIEVVKIGDIDSINDLIKNKQINLRDFTFNEKVNLLYYPFKNNRDVFKILYNHTKFIIPPSQLSHNLIPYMWVMQNLIGDDIDLTEYIKNIKKEYYNMSNEEKMACKLSLYSFLEFFLPSRQTVYKNAIKDICGDISEDNKSSIESFMLRISNDYTRRYKNEV